MPFHRKAPDALIGYVRVSTTAQGRSWLDLEAQREALAHLCRNIVLD
jgi:DNA invertase Pin-like site-specific DNA recombinase